MFEQPRQRKDESGSGFYRNLKRTDVKKLTLKESVAGSVLGSALLDMAEQICSHFQLGKFTCDYERRWLFLKVLGGNYAEEILKEVVKDEDCASSERTQGSQLHPQIISTVGYLPISLHVTTSTALSNFISRFITFLIIINFSNITYFLWLHFKFTDRNCFRNDA